MKTEEEIRYPECNAYIHLEWKEDKIKELQLKGYEQVEKDILEKINSFRESCFSLHLSKKDLFLFNQYYKKLIKSIGEGK